MKKLMPAHKGALQYARPEISGLQIALPCVHNDRHFARDGADLGKQARENTRQSKALDESQISMWRREIRTGMQLRKGVEQKLAPAHGSLAGSGKGTQIRPTCR